MSLFNDKLSILANYRLGWLSARGNVLSNNIAVSEVKSIKRRELRPFHEVLKKESMHALKAAKNYHSFKVKEDDIMQTKTEISKELEMLELSRNSLEHDAIINMVKNFHQLVKSTLSFHQGNN